MAAHPNVETLRTIYADLTCIADHCDDDVVLHTADRAITDGPGIVRGKDAVLAQEKALIRATGGTLLMDVQDIIANDHFGAVTGILRARLATGDVAMPFCGLWRFRDGRIIEHWENAYQASVLLEAFTTTS